MRQRDQSLNLIGQGDRRRTNVLWADELLERAGDQLDKPYSR